MRNAVGFYWTLPVPWAGFTTLPEDIDAAAKVSRTIRYQCDLIRRHAVENGYTLVAEKVFLEIAPDRGSQYVLEALRPLEAICRAREAVLLFVDFSEVQGWRGHGPLSDWATRTDPSRDGLSGRDPDRRWIVRPAPPFRGLAREAARVDRQQTGACRPGARCGCEASRRRANTKGDCARAERQRHSKCDRKALDRGQHWEVAQRCTGLKTPPRDPKHRHRYAPFGQRTQRLRLSGVEALFPTKAMDTRGEFLAGLKLRSLERRGNFRPNRKRRGSPEQRRSAVQSPAWPWRAVSEVRMGEAKPFENTTISAPRGAPVRVRNSDDGGATGTGVE